MRILIVEDDEDLAEVLLEILTDEAYAADVAADGDLADELMAVNDYDLVLLDWTIPGPSGIELLQSWREEGKQTPVLMLTGRGGIDDRVDGLDTGADDYLSKPFEMEELLARIRSLMRRRGQPLRPMRAGDLELDRSSRRVTVGGELLKLTPKEFGVLEYLLGRVGETVTRTELTDHVWDDSFDAMSNVVDVILYRLRKKIDGGRDEKLLTTIKGIGYVLHAERTS